MAGHHDSHHATEKKPVAFTVPFILAAVLVLIIGLFLSLCDPSHAHGSEGHGHNNIEGAHSDGHKNATDKEMINHGEAKGPDAVPETDQSHSAH